MQQNPGPEPAVQLSRHLHSALDTICREWGRHAFGDLMACELFGNPAERNTYRNGIMQGVSRILQSADELLSKVEHQSGQVAQFSTPQRDWVSQALKKAIDSCERFNRLRSGPSSAFTNGLAQAESYGASKLDTPEGWEVLAGVDAARERAAFTFDATQVEASCTNNNLLIEKLRLLESALLRSWNAS